MTDTNTDFRNSIARGIRSIRPRSYLVPTTNTQRGGDVTSLAFSRFCRTGKPNALAWLTGFHAGYYGAAYVWPLGTLDPEIWALGFIVCRGHRGHQ